MGVHTKLQNQIQTEIQNRIQQTKQVIKSTVPPKLMERADQVLLELSHTGQTIPNLLKQTFKKIEGNPHDVIGRLGRTVIERAESVRATLTRPMVNRAAPETAPETTPEAVAVETAEPVAAQASELSAPKKKPVRKKVATKAKTETEAPTRKAKKK